MKICPDEPVITDEDGFTVALKTVTATAIGVPADIEIELEIKNITPVGTAAAGLRVTGTVVVGCPAELIPMESETMGAGTFGGLTATGKIVWP